MKPAVPKKSKDIEGNKLTVSEVVDQPSADTMPVSPKAATKVESRPHGALLSKKAKKDAKLDLAYIAYKQFAAEAATIEVLDKDGVKKLVDAFNEYRRQTIYVFEDGDNVPQSNLRSTMMEEFLGWLFKDIFVILAIPTPQNFKIGKSGHGYLKLTFAPHSFEKMFANPNPCISVKNQDFALGASYQLTISPNIDEAEDIAAQIILPVVAIECKTYLAKNHLDMCSSTATDIKRAVPYCMYIIVCEFIKLVKTASPELTDISEIYVMCKAENGDRKRRRAAGLDPHLIDADVVVDLHQRVLGHLRSIWWDPDTALQRGKVIARPF